MRGEDKTELVYRLHNRALLAVGLADVIDALDRLDGDLTAVEVADVLRRVHERVIAP